VEDGPYRARRPTGERTRALEDPEDVLARHGLLGSGPEPPPSAGRVARRRAEEGEPPGTSSPTASGRHAAEPGSGRSGAGRRAAQGNGHPPAPPYDPLFDPSDRPRDQHRNGYAATEEPPRASRRADPPPARRHPVGPPADVEPWPDHADPPSTGGHRRRAPDPLVGPGAGEDRRRPPAPDAGLPNGSRRHQLDPEDDPFGAGRYPAEPIPYGGRRRVPDAPDTSVVSTGGTRRRSDPGDAPDVPAGGRRHREEHPDNPARTRWSEAGGPATTALPAGVDGRRRRFEPDDPGLPPTGDRRRAATPVGATADRRRPVDDPDAPGGRARGEHRQLPETGTPTSDAASRRRRLDPADDPARPPTGERPWVAEPIGPSATTALPAARHRGGTEQSDPFDETRARGAPPPTTTNGSPRRQRPDRTDAPDPPPAGERPWVAEPIGPSATTALPAAARRRSTAAAEAPLARRGGVEPVDPPGDPRARGRRLDTGAPTTDANGGPRRRRPGPVDDPPPAERRHPAEPNDRSATTAHPAPPRRHPTDDPDARRRHVDPDHPAPARERRRLADPVDPTTALPPVSAGRRRTSDPDPPDAPAFPAMRGPRRPHPTEAPPTTAFPADGDRRRHPDAEPPAATALPAGARSRRDVASAEATAVVPAADRPTTTKRRSGRPDGDQTDSGRSGSRSDREGDAHTRAMRIDETLTRLTAAHAGLTLAVTDRPAEEEIDVPRQRRGVAVTAGRLLAGALALVVLGATAFGWGTKTWLGAAVPDAAALDPGSSAVVDAAAQTGDENVLVVATDPAPEEGQPRADTVAVAHIPDGGGPVTVLAFPLALEINRPPCEAWDADAATYGDQPVQAEASTQLVTALDRGGPRCVTRVVQQLSGLAITRYVGIDLRAVPALTEAVGGAEVCVPRPVLDGVLGPVVPDAGTNRLTGVRAADFVHAGDVEGDPSAEYGRIQRQQQVLAAVLDSAVSGTALLDVGRLAGLRPALSEAVLTDGAEIDQVLALSMTLRRLDADGVQYATVPTGEQNDRGNAVLRDTDAAALFAAVRADGPLPTEATDPGAGTSGPTPSEVTVEVVNASTRSGLAGEVGETLRSLGFGVGEISSADQPTSETVIRFSPDQATAAEVLAATVPSATSVPDPGTTGVLQLVLGQSFDDVVRAPAEPIALAAPTAEAPAEPGVTCA
jgi:LCP family protein required for cell wall assembly